MLNSVISLTNWAGLFFLLTITGTSAATIDLDISDQSDFADGVLNAHDKAFDGGLTLTFTNIIGSDGLPGSYIGSNGIYLSNDRHTFDAVSFDLVFSADTVLIGYDIDNERTRNGSFLISGSDGASGPNALYKTGRFAFDMGSLAYFAAGETYSLTHTGLGRRGFAAIDEFDYTLIESIPATVPAPPTAPLMLAGMLGVLSVVRRNPFVGRT